MTETLPATDLQHQITTARAEALQILRTINALRDNAGELTAEAASRNDWCDYAERAVTAAGCHWPSNEVTFDLILNLKVTCDVHPENRNEVSPGWVESSLNLDDVYGAVNLDGDWDTDTLNVELNSHTVSNIVRG